MRLLFLVPWIRNMKQAKLVLALLVIFNWLFHRSTCNSKLVSIGYKSIETKIETSSIILLHISELKYRIWKRTERIHIITKALVVLKYKSKILYNILKLCSFRLSLFSVTCDLPKEKYGTCEPSMSLVGVRQKGLMQGIGAQSVTLFHIIFLIVEKSSDASA